LEISASVGFIHKESIAMHGHTVLKVEAEVTESNAASVDKLLLFIKYGQIMKLS
jgi:hypothetical protein